MAEHTKAEGELLRRYSAGARCVVEIGVSEGGSAWQLGKAMDPDGTLYLIDPYVPGSLPRVNMAKLVARRLMREVDHGRVRWLEKASHEVARNWCEEIDFLFIDGDHSLEAVTQDWNMWSRWIRDQGFVALHDAVLFPEGWTSRSDGPVQLLESLRGDEEWELQDSADSTAILRRVASLKS